LGSRCAVCVSLFLALDCVDNMPAVIVAVARDMETRLRNEAMNQPCRPQSRPQHALRCKRGANNCKRYSARSSRAEFISHIYECTPNQLEFFCSRSQFCINNSEFSCSITLQQNPAPAPFTLQSLHTPELGARWRRRAILLPLGGRPPFGRR
jgi:hypothetical protein